MKWSWSAAYAALFMLVSHANTAAAATPDVKIWLQSSWEAPSILLEALETAAIEEPTIYHPLLTLLSSPEAIAALDHPHSHPHSDRSQLSTFHDLLNSSSVLAQHPKFDLSSFKASLALHVAQPKLEAYARFYTEQVEDLECENWVWWDDKGYCDAEVLKKEMEETIEGDGDDSVLTATTPPIILPFDHILPSRRLPSNSSAHTAILYLSSFTASQANLLAFLESHSKRIEEFRFVVRYKSGTGGGRKSSLGGYGVEMVLKNTDYLAVDDRVTGEQTALVDSETARIDTTTRDQVDLLGALGDDPWKDLERPLRPTEIADLGLRTTSFILSSPDPLRALKSLSQDFPLYSAALARKVPLTAKDELLAHCIVENQQAVRMGPGFCGMWINGRPIKDSEVDAFSLLDIVREERHRILSLVSLGMTPQQAHDLLTDERIGAAQTNLDPTVGLVDASDRPEGGDVILWWNNIEKDKRYSDWASSITPLFRPTRPGSFQTVKQNIWNVVLVLDLSQRTSIHVLAHTIGTLIQRGIPFRFGLVPMLGSDDDNSVKMARFVVHSFKANGRRPTMDMLRDISQAGPPTAAVDLRLVEGVYNHHAAELQNAASFADIVSGRLPTANDDYLSRARIWAARVGAVRDATSFGHVFFNGRHSEFGETWTQQIMQDYMAQLAHLVSPAIAPTAKKIKRLGNYFYDLPSTSKRRNLYILPSESKNPLRLLEIEQLQGLHLPPYGEQYMYPSDAKFTPLTTRIVADFDSKDGRQLLKHALQSLHAHDSSQRLAFIHHPAHSNQSPPWLATVLYRLIVSSSLASLSPQQLLHLVDELEQRIESSTNEEGAPVVEQVVMSLPSLGALFGSEGWYSADVAAAKLFWQGHAPSLEELGLGPGSSYVIANGRLLGPVNGSNFHSDDFVALAAFEMQRRTQPAVHALIEALGGSLPSDRALSADLIMGASTIVAGAYASPKGDVLGGNVAMPRRDMSDFLANKISSFKVAEPKDGIVRIFAILDPVSEKAQKWSALLELISRLDHVAAEVLLNPAMEMTEVPVKRFFRYEARLTVDFDIEGRISPHGAEFKDLPGEPIFTLGMDVPSAWLVSPRRSIHDLDNLRLDAIGVYESVVDLVFELDQLIVDGHAREEGGEAPRGLQLQLSSSQGAVLADTSVMANLGYFQFKANPGLLRFGIRPGPGTDIYDLQSMQDARTGQDLAPKDWVSVTSFQGRTVIPVFKRRKGMEEADVLTLVPKEHAQPWWSQLKSTVSRWIGTTPVTMAPSSAMADINIFTVASGLLYERFASIMILSVMRHTNSTVKFWFIENFLSPSFLEFIPLLAEEYGFQYELITYKWPSWLRAQKEKQRTIWGYKILFLDVLFPMNLDKVIFVDADQIVRTDMKELVDVDLHGRVYGYAPMGDDKQEMEGFRFWKQGYWKDALRGRPYHISALYVVDLKRFRQLAAGDRLRAQYQALSQDPNSLSNLDQDLPNSMQDQLPIFTLDQSWLWCETWCSQESLKVAKTIDLCQNPLTKEPKLNRARAIPEWDSYDQEIASFARRVSERNKELISVARGMGQGVDEMAGLASTPAPEIREHTEDEGEPEEAVRIVDEL